MKGEITISRTQSSHRGQFMSIRISDSLSRLGIVDVEISLEDFTKCITGQWSECEITRLPSVQSASRFGLERESIRVTCERVGYDKDAQKAKVLKDFQEKHEPAGWELDSDGTGTQQSGAAHTYIICRWNEAKGEA
jgi:hypothetical protein